MKRLLIFAVIVIFAICAGVYSLQPKTPISFGSFSFIQEEVLGELTSIQTEKTRMRFVGDIMLARNVENFMDAYGAFYPFSLLPEVSPDAYLVGNFEASIPKTHVKTQSMQFSFSVKPEYVVGLSQYGFTHLGLANNHAFDFGADDFIHTVAQLQLASTTPFGSPLNNVSSSTSILKVGDTTIALIGLYAVQEIPSQNQIEELVKKAEELSNVQIVYVHWGEEYELVHSKTQEVLAHALIDAGVDIIVGHHPHVVQDIQLYKNKPIFYSLGNFIFDQYFSDDVQKGLMLDLVVGADGFYFELLPVTSIGSRSVPREMTQYERALFLADLANNSDTELATMIEKGQLYIPF